MKKIILLLVIVICGCSADFSYEYNTSTHTYFCPGECENVLTFLINNSKESIDCAFFDLGLEGVKEALEKKSAQIPVRLLIEGDNYEDFGKKETNYAYMHNKFCIIDNRITFTGSMNPTNNGAYKNNNNLVVINSKLISNNYLIEFEELWSGVYGKGDRTQTPIVVLDNVTYETYFCPEDDCRGKVLEKIRLANKSIYFITFSFTDGGIASEILLKRDLDIKGILESRQCSKHSVWKLLEYQGLDVQKDSNPNSMHHKVFIIDEEIVITGSYNPTKNGNEKNDENVLIIHNKEIAQEYVAEFNVIYSASSY